MLRLAQRDAGAIPREARGARERLASLLNRRGSDELSSAWAPIVG
jgi:hypothetical protein